MVNYRPFCGRRSFTSFLCAERRGSEANERTEKRKKHEETGSGDGGRGHPVGVRRSAAERRRRIECVQYQNLLTIA